MSDGIDHLYLYPKNGVLIDRKNTTQTGHEKNDDTLRRRVQETGCGECCAPPGRAANS